MYVFKISTNKAFQIQMFEKVTNEVDLLQHLNFKLIKM